MKFSEWMILLENSELISLVNQLMEKIGATNPRYLGGSFTDEMLYHTLGDSWRKLREAGWIKQNEVGNYEFVPGILTQFLK